MYPSRFLGLCVAAGIANALIQFSRLSWNVSLVSSFAVGAALMALVLLAARGVALLIARRQAQRTAAATANLFAARARTGSIDRL